MKPQIFDNKYQEKLRSIPETGCGCHPALLGAANLGVMAGVSTEKIFDDIRASLPSGGKRRVRDREIMDAVQRATADHGGQSWPFTPKAAPVVKDGKTALQKIIQQGRFSKDADLWEDSPLRIDWQPEEDAGRFLSIMYDPGDLIFIGERHDAGIMGETIRPADEWIEYFQKGGKTAPHFIINPLNGLPAAKKNGDGTTLRGDGNILKFRYCLVEFDGIPRADQIRFWSAAALPVRALLDSAGKSIHALLDVRELAEATSLEHWATSIKGNLYDRLLTPLGVDSACSNPARLSRLPGHFRVEKREIQKILWLKGGIR